MMGGNDGERKRPGKPRPGGDPSGGTFVQARGLKVLRLPDDPGGFGIGGKVAHQPRQLCLAIGEHFLAADHGNRTRAQVLARAADLLLDRRHEDHSR